MIKVTWRLLSIIVIPLLSLLSACDDEQNVQLERKALFTLDVTPTFGDVNTWVFISNKHGKVITYKSFDPGDKLTLEGDIEKDAGEITVTILYKSLAFGTIPDLFTIYSFTNVQIGSKWVIPGVTLPVTTGGANIRISNLPVPASAVFSSLDGIFGDTRTITSSQQILPVSARNEPIDYFISIIGPGNPKYTVIENITTSQTIQALNYTTDFKNFDNNLPISVSKPVKFSARISGYQADFNQTSFLDSKYHRFYDKQTDQFAPTSFTIGFNDGYKFYSINWTAALEKQSTSYYKIGAAPEPKDFIIPEYEVTLLNKEPNNFRFTSSIDFEFVRGHWTSPPVGQFGSTFSWRVSSAANANHPIINEFPEEFLSQNPTFEDLLNSISFRDAYFYDVKIGYSYQDHIDESFIPQFPLHQWEYYFFVKTE